MYIIYFSILLFNMVSNCVTTAYNNFSNHGMTVEMSMSKPLWTHGLYRWTILSSRLQEQETVCNSNSHDSWRIQMQKILENIIHSLSNYLDYDQCDWICETGLFSMIVWNVLLLCNSALFLNKNTFRIPVMFGKYLWHTPQAEVRRTTSLRQI